MKKRRYKIRYDNITLLISIVLLIIIIIDFKNIMDLVLYNPYHKGLTVIIRLFIEITLFIKAVFYTIEKKTL